MRTFASFATLTLLIGCQSHEHPPITYDIHVYVDSLEDTDDTDDPTTEDTGDTAEPEELKYLCSPSQPFIYYLGPEGERHPFGELVHYFTYEDDFVDITHITDEEMAAIPLGRTMPVNPRIVLTKITSDPTAYWVEPTADPYEVELRAIPDEATAVAMIGPSWNQYILDVPEWLFVDYLIGDPITDPTDVPVDVSQMKTADELWPY